MAFSYFVRRYRYIVSRWGHAPNLLAWELWNEVDLTQNYKPNEVNCGTWHGKAYSALRNLDPYRHLITTSFAIFPGSTYIWPLMDYTMVHGYGAVDMADMARTTIAKMLTLDPNKPSYVAEFGTDWNWNNPGLVDNDRTGINIHNEQWGSLMAKASGAGFSWWWDNIIDPQNQYYHYKGIAAFVAGEDLAQQGYQPVRFAASTKVESDAIIAPILDWGVKPPSNLFVLNPDGTLSPDTSSLSQMQYGVSAHPDLRNPPTFQVHYPTKGKFLMSIVLASPTGATAQVKVDGISAGEKTFPSGPANFTLEADVSAGDHKITVDSIASDWYQVGSFVFTNCSIPLESTGLIGKTKVLGWVRSRVHTWFQVKHNYPQPIVSDGVVSVNICTDPSTWNLQWWDTTSGKISQQSQLACSCSNGHCSPLELKVPLIDSTTFDWAFKLLLTR